MGDGMVHGFFLEDGKAKYRNRWVRTPTWVAEHAAGHVLPPMYGGPREGGVANTNILAHAGKLLALEEAHEPFEIDAKTLDTKGGYQATGGRFTAHPKIDPETGELIWFAYSAGPAPLNAQIDFGTSDATGKVTRRERFEAPYCSMIHDFLVTRNWALIPVLPLVGDMPRAIAGGFPFAWDPSKGAHLALINRAEGVSSLRWFEAPMGYVFHPMNAWEEGTKIHCEVFEYPHAPLFPAVDGSELPRAPAVLVRWTIDTAGDTAVVTRTQLDDLPGEFPRLDERFAGLAYRHGFFAGYQRHDEIAGFDCLAHIDLKTGKQGGVRLRGGRCAQRGGVRAPLSRRRRRRRLAAGHGLSRRLQHQRHGGARRHRYPGRTGGYGARPAPHPLRLPRQLGRSSTLAWAFRRGRPWGRDRQRLSQSGQEVRELGRGRFRHRRGEGAPRSLSARRILSLAAASACSSISS